MIYKITPTNIYPKAISQPNKISQIILATGCESKSVRTFFPNGNTERAAILKHWSPNGIPMIVMHHKTPVIIHATNDNNHTKINQIIFPNNLIPHSPIFKII